MSHHHDVTAGIDIGDRYSHLAACWTPRVTR